MKKQPASLIAQLLNKKSQPDAIGTPLAESNQIIMRDVHDLVPNPKNQTYSLDNIEELAMMMQVTHTIEPITVRETEDHTYMIISGHRRRLAHLYRLENGLTNDPMVPTLTKEIVNDFQGIISNDEMETLNIVFPNKGQRRRLTPSQEADEIALIEPIIKKLYQQQRKEGEVQGPFRQFFADLLGISSAALQRKQSLTNLAEDIKEAVDQGEITATAAAELSGLEHEEQAAVLEHVKQNNDPLTVQNIKEGKDTLRKTKEEDPPENVTESPVPTDSEEEISDDVNTASEVPESPYDITNAEKDAADIEKDASAWVLAELGTMMQHAIKMTAQEKAAGNEIAAANWDIRRAKVVLLRSLLND